MTQTPDRKAVWVPPPVHRVIRVLAAQEGVSAAAVVAWAVRELVKSEGLDTNPLLAVPFVTGEGG